MWIFYNSVILSVIELPAMVVGNEEMLKLVLLIKKKKKVGETMR